MAFFFFCRFCLFVLSEQHIRAEHSFKIVNAQMVRFELWPEYSQVLLVLYIALIRVLWQHPYIVYFMPLLFHYGGLVDAQVA